jgi:hypothetical protein
MAAIRNGVTAGAITALVAAVLGVVGTHAGHVAGHELAAKQSQPRPGLEQLARLHAEGKLTDDEFAAAIRMLLS